jgi:acyl-CoA dehydrogenase
MNFELTDRCKDYQERVQASMNQRIYPAEPVYESQMREAGDPNFHPPILEELKDPIAQRELRKWEQLAAQAPTGHARPAARVG